MASVTTFTPFNLTSMNIGAEQLYRVQIVRPTSTNNNPGIVEGYASDRPRISMSPQYDKLGGSIPIIGPVIQAGEQSLLSLFDSPQVGNGLTTQKVFKGASDIQLDVNMTVIDYIGDGIVTEMAKRLMQWCSPRKFVPSETANDAIKVGAAVGKAGVDSATDVASAFASSDGFAQTTTNTVNAVNEGLNKIAGAFGELSRMQLVLSIGDFVSSLPVVLSNCTITFSREQGVRGPLFGEFSLSFVSFKTLTDDQIAKHIYPTDSLKSRVKILEAGTDNLNRYS